MVIISKGADGSIDHDQHPPGYQYVGNERYGQWRDDRSGGSFWEFYGRYALLSYVIGGFGRPIYRTDWNAYRDSRGLGQPLLWLWQVWHERYGHETEQPQFLPPPGSTAARPDPGFR